MDEVKKPYYDKEFFPSDGGIQDEREETVFARDFLIAERFGLAAVRDTWRRAFAGWKGNIKYMTELCVVMNHLCWRANGKRWPKLTEMYREYYHKCRDHVFGDETPFDDKERAFFYDVID